MKIAAIFARLVKPHLSEKPPEGADRSEGHSGPLIGFADFFANTHLIHMARSGDIGSTKIAVDQRSESDRLADSKFAMKHRIERVCEVLKRELGQIILRELTFPTPLVTISGVDITPDLKQAHVYVSALGTDVQRESVLAVLEQNRGMLQAEVSKRVVLKHTPHLNFKLDDSIARGSRVLNILDDLGLDEAK